MAGWTPSRALPYGDKSSHNSRSPLNAHIPLMSCPVSLLCFRCSDSPSSPSLSPSSTLLLSPPPESEWVDLRSFGPHLPTPDAGLLAFAHGLMTWRSKHVSYSLPCQWQAAIHKSVISTDDLVIMIMCTCYLPKMTLDLTSDQLWHIS